MKGLAYETRLMADPDGSVINELKLPYSRVIRRISHISAYSLISAYAYPVTNTHC